MAETPSKRQREETQMEEVEETKRHKSYNHILSLLDAEEDEPSQDLSYLITTLQQELSSDSTFDPSQTPNDPENNPTTAAAAAAVDDCTTATSSSSTPSKEDEEDDRDRVIRHLLEASDDELGIPNMEAGVGNVEFGDEIGFNGGDGGFSMCNGLWELEDEAANYYTLLQSELFM